jgi:hypothetical protein
MAMSLSMLSDGAYDCVAATYDCSLRRLQQHQRAQQARCAKQELSTVIVRSNIDLRSHIETRICNPHLECAVLP